MTLSDFGLIFASIVLGSVVISGVSTKHMMVYQQKITQYNLAIDNALEAALIDSVEVDRGMEVFSNKKEMVDVFLENLASNLGVLANPYAKRQLKYQIPMLCIVENDGFYFWHAYRGKNFDVDSESGFEKKRLWDYKSADGTLYFTLSEYVHFEDNYGRHTLEGYYKDVYDMLPYSVQWDRNTMNEIRQKTIVSILQEEMEYVINQHNSDARKNGLNYQIHFPVIREEEWYRTMEGPGMFVFFQGHTFGTGTLGTYNKMAFGGARRKKHAPIA